VLKDSAQAVDWFRKAAEQDDAAAQNGLGVMYRDGEGVPKDSVRAVDWFRKSAEHGDGYGQMNLGWMYSEGEGIPRDFITACMWFNLAAAHGLDDAKNNRNIIEKRMTAQQIGEAQKLSREWKPTKSTSAVEK
jgi:uncharacterized protein